MSENQSFSSFFWTICDDDRYAIHVDRETRVMYLETKSGDMLHKLDGGSSMTVMVNADGSPRTYTSPKTKEYCILD